MPASLADEGCVEAAGSIDGDHADNDWPAELVRAGEDDGRSIGQKLEEILERCFDGRERAPELCFNLLAAVLVPDTSVRP